MHEAQESIEFAMTVHEFLDDNGIKTPRPARTSLGRFTHIHNNQLFVVQTFIHGEDIYEPYEAIDPLLPFYGKKLGEIHTVLLKMPQTEIGERQKAQVGSFTWLRNASLKYMPDDDYVKEQYEIWTREIEKIHDAQLTVGITHGDVGPKDFFFEDGEFTGFMDLNAAGYSFLLMDVVSMMMYSGLFRPDRTEQYLTFIRNYLESAPIELEELKWLHLLLRTRWFVQIFFHNYRYKEGITQGLDTDETEGNLVGVREAIEYLRITNDYPDDHFFKILVE
jgi:Ser/Thr protein kinase RdoA (MazF antagonist)